MAGDFYSPPKGTLIIKLPRKSSLLLRMIVLAAIMMCSIYMSYTCLKQTTIYINPETVRTETIKNHSYGSKIVGLKQTEIPIKPELTRTFIEERSFDPGIVGLKQRDVQISNDPVVVSLEKSVTQKSPEFSSTKPMEDHSNDPRIGSLTQTDKEIKSDTVISKPTEGQAFDPRIIGLKQAKVQIKPEPVTIKSMAQKIQVKPEPKKTKPMNQTKVQVQPKFMRINRKQPSCQKPRIPESEIPYVHYPVPTNYSRRQCACTPVRFYVIISIQRSGSKWLESLLNSHENISSNGEIFIDRTRSANDSAITSTLDTVYNLDWRYSFSRRRCIAAVGFKWMVNQRVIENHEVVFNYFKRRGVSIIFLFRRNLLRRMVSLLANSQDHKQINGTHKAHVNTQQEADRLASFKPKLNAKLLVSKLKHTTARIAEAMEHFKSIRHMVLYYEDLVQNNTQKQVEILDFLKVSQKTLVSHHVKIHTRPLSEMIRNWNNVRRALKRTQFESFLTSD